MPVGTCVLGVGRLGSEHARILASLPGSRLEGVHDLDPERGEAVAARVGTRHFADASALLSRADAAVVAVPTAVHHAVARAALAAGCHVLVEKPLAATLAEADDLIALAADRGVRLAVGHVERFNPVLRHALVHVDEPRFVESERLSPFQPRGTDVTVVLDLMIHDLDLVLGLLRARVASVSAVGVPVLSGSVDIANARLGFDNGAVANITASRVSVERKRKLRLFQPTGYLSLDLTAGRGEFLRRRRGAWPDQAWPDPPGPADGARARGDADPRGLLDVVERVPLSADGPEPLRLELEAFLRAVRGEPSDSVSGGEGRAALELALTITREIEESAHVAAQDP